MRGQSYSNKHNNLHKEDSQGGETKVMKKSLKMLLIFALVFSMLTPALAFAEEAELTAQAKYDALVEAGIFQGHGDGTAGLEENMNRGQLAVVLARLLEIDDSQVSTSSSYPDVAASHWASYSIEALTAAGVFTGHGDGTFGVNDNMTFEQIVVTTIRALGLEEDALEADLPVDGTVSDWAQAHVGFALFLGLVQAQEDYKFEATRADLVGASYDVHLVIEASKAPSVKALEVKSVTATTNTSIEVALEEEVTAADTAAATFSIEGLAVTGSELSSNGKVVTLKTAAQTAGSLYVVKYNGAEYKVVGQLAVTKALEVSSAALSTSNVKVTVNFTEAVGTSALNAANYTINNNLQVLAVEYSSSAKTGVVLTTSTQTAGTLYTVTVANVLDVHGNTLAAAKNIAYFGGKAADTAGPEVVSSAIAATNTAVNVTFGDASALNKATVENIANYSINNSLEVTAASYDADTKTVKLTTSSQTAGTLYTVTVSGVTDEFGNAVKSDANKAYFGGKAKDTAGLEVQTSATSVANNKVDVTLVDASGIDKATAENAANYTVNNNLTVTEAKLNATTKVVTLTTSAQTAGTLYTVTVSSVTDEYGNVVKSDANKAYFGGKAVDTSNPTYTALSIDANTVKVTFSTKVDAKTVMPYNFNIEGLGYALKSTVDSTDATGKTVTLKTVGQSAGKIYKLEARNVTNLDGTAVKTDSSTNFAGKSAASTAAPRVLAAVAIDKKTVRVELNQNIVAAPTVTIKNNDATKTTFDAATSVQFEGSSKTSLLVRLDASKELVEGTLYYVDVTNAIGSNGVALDADYSQVLFAGSSAASEGPKVISAVALDNNTVDVYFDKAVKFATSAADTALTVKLTTDANAPVNYADTSAATAKNAVLSADGKKMTLFFTKDGTTLSLTEGTIYKVKFESLVKVVDTFNTSLVANNTTTEATFKTVQFAAVSTAVSGPQVVTAVAVDRYTVDVVFNAPVSLTVENQANFASIFTIEGITTPPVAVLARAEGTDKVRVFFNEDTKTALNEGVAYTLRYNPDANNYVAGTNGMKAQVGSTTGYTNVTFAAIATAPAGPAISAIENVNANTIKVTVSKAVYANVTAANIVVKEGAATISASDYVVVNAANKKSFQIVLNNGVFEAGATYSVALNATILDESQLRVASTTAQTIGGTANADLVLTAALATNTLTATLVDSDGVVVVGKQLRLRIITNLGTATTITGGNPVATDVSGQAAWDLGSHEAGELYILEATDGTVAIYFVR